MNIATLLQTSERPFYPPPQPWQAPPSPYSPIPYSPSPYPTPSPAHLPHIAPAMARRKFDPRTGGYKGSKIPKRRGTFRAERLQQRPSHPKRWHMNEHEPMEDVIFEGRQATQRKDHSDKASQGTRDKTRQSDRSKSTSRNPSPIDPRPDSRTIKRPPPVRLVLPEVVTPPVAILPPSSSPAKEAAPPAPAGEVTPPESPAAWSPGNGWEDYSPTAAAAAAELNATSAPFAQKSAASPPPFPNMTNFPPPAPPSPPPGNNVGQNGDTSAAGDISGAASGWYVCDTLPERFSLNTWPPLPEEDPPESPMESTLPLDMEPAQAPDLLPELRSRTCEIVFCDEEPVELPPYSLVPVAAPHLIHPVRLHLYL